MTSERSRAYGRVMRILEDLGPTKLQPAEIALVRDAADTLLFSEDLAAPGAREALEEIEALAGRLADSGRWTGERASQLAEDVSACGPVASLGAR